MPKFLLIPAQDKIDELSGKSGALLETLNSLFSDVRDSSDNFKKAQEHLNLLAAELDPLDEKSDFAIMLKGLNKVVSEVFPNTMFDAKANLSDAKDILNPKFDIKLGSNISTKVEQQGTGVVRSAVFAMLRYRSIRENEKSRKENSTVRPLFIAFEEPEIYLHPKAAFQMRETIYELAREHLNQIICTTHSPYMIDLSKKSSQILNSLHFNKEMIGRGDRQLEVELITANPFNISKAFRSLHEDDQTYVKLLLKIDDSIAKIFFARNILIIEGDTEDIVLRETIYRMNEAQNLEIAYKRYWNEQNINVGFVGVPTYKNSIKNTPHICFKVPTGGGKTFLACSAIKPVFDAMPLTKSKVVVWLVPSNSILEQTIKNLKDTSHPYRQKIDTDFNGRVEIYTKDQLLCGQNFNPTSVNEQLSILILSYDSLRSNRKDGRKAYQENGVLVQFTRFYNTPETLIEGIDDSALIQVINQLSPIVIVDESHNAQTDLSVEMLINLNPSFVIDLTATPKENSNIISYVDAVQLKKENMVKLPVIVYNRHNQRDVLLDAIDLRNKLEKQAKSEQAETGRYIRPIVLFQAQPKGKENSENFEKLKEELVNTGIPAEYIAIKTSDVNELKGIDLLSASCSIRYIITVNALKEGWDCPFAYILATLANRTSRVDVEQILGRILRQPYTKQHKNSFLNMSYVLTSSNNFRETLEKIVVGLNKAGFSKNDYRVADFKETNIIPEIDRGNFELINNDHTNASELKETNTNNPTEEFLDLNFNEVKELLEQRNDLDETDNSTNEGIVEMLTSAIAQNEEYTYTVEEIQNSVDGFQPRELRDKMKRYKINDSFKDEVKNICVPQFFIKSEPSIFITDGLTLLTKESLAEGFTLKDKDTAINFDTVDNDIVKIDIEGVREATPKYSKLSQADSKYFKEYFSKLPQESKVRNCKEMIYRQINKIDTVDDRDLRNYIDRIVENMTKDHIDNLENSVHYFADKIKKKILSLQDEYLEKQFEKMIEEGKIICKDNYSFKDEISPLNSISSISKSLYVEEENINNFEYKVITEVIGLDNIKWWHRNIEKRGFGLNGFINYYPDVIVMTNRGNLVVIEIKGDHLENTESKQKVKLGRTWQHQVGNQYRYYMVFENKDLKIEGAYQFDKFMDIIKNL